MCAASVRRHNAWDTTRGAVLDRRLGLRHDRPARAAEPGYSRSSRGRKGAAAPRAQGLPRTAEGRHRSWCEVEVGGGRESPADSHVESERGELTKGESEDGKKPPKRQSPQDQRLAWLASGHTLFCSVRRPRAQRASVLSLPIHVDHVLCLFKTSAAIQLSPRKRSSTARKRDHPGPSQSSTSLTSEVQAP